jgi:DNA-binding protein YbaB
MAYDPNDAADKKIVSDLVKAAVAKATEELTAEHEENISGLKTKNADLVTRLKKAQEGVKDPEEISRLETQLDTVKAELKEAKKAATKALNELKETTEELTTERTTATESLVKASLTEELTKAKVAPTFIPAVTALLRPQVVVKADGGEKKVFVGDKSLGDHITAWSQSDEGKAYISATVNGGTGAPGGSANKTGGKTMSRSDFNALPLSEQAAVARSTETQIVDA